MEKQWEFDRFHEDSYGKLFFFCFFFLNSSVIDLICE